MSLILCMAQMRFCCLLLLPLLVILTSLGSAVADPAARPFHFLVLLVLSILLPSLLTSWLVPGGFAWRKHSGSAPTAQGPVGWPLFGSLPLMADPLAHRKLADLSKAHGAGDLMALSLGATRVVISSRPDTAKEILHGAAFSDRPAKLSARLLMFEAAIGFAPAGDYWRLLRRAASAGMFCPRRILASAVLRQRIAEDMIGRIRKEMDGNGSVRLRGVLHRGSLESVMGSVFGRSTLGQAETDELMGMVREGYELIGTFNLEDYFPVGGLLDVHGVGRRCRDLAARVKDLIGRTVEERRKRGARCMQTDDDFLGVLLGLPEEEQLCDSDMVTVLWEMLFRGTDVVVVLLEWIMARMVLHPDIQAKAQRELDAVVGSRPVEDSDVPKLRYLQAVVKEVLRMHPPAPLLSWARLAVRDAVVGGYFVPAGTTAMVNMWAISHDESNWKDTWEFRPARFLEEEEEGKVVSVMGSDVRLAPFGAGRRVCPGRALGLATVHLWLACLLQRHRWVAARPVDLSESLRLSMEMEKPLVCRAVRRILLC